MGEWIAVGVDVVCKLAINRETKGGEQGCQGPQTSITNFYKSSPFRTSLSSNSLTVSKLQNGTDPSLVDKSSSFPPGFPPTRRTGASDAPVLEAPCPYPSKNLDSSSVTLATRNFLNKLSSGIKESPLKDSPPNPTGEEPDRTSEIESLATSATHSSESSPSKKSAHADPPEILTTSHSSDIVDTSLCTSLIVPAETLETSGCNSPIVSAQRELLPPRFPQRRLFRRLHTSNEETQVKTGSGLMNDQLQGEKAPPVISQNDDFSQETLKCTPASTQEPCCTNNAGKSIYHPGSSCYF